MLPLGFTENFALVNIEYRFGIDLLLLILAQVAKIEKWGSGMAAGGRVLMPTAMLRLQWAQECLSFGTDLLGMD